MLLTHTRNANFVNRVRATLHSIANIREKSRNHIENSTTRIRVDEQAVQDIEACLIEFESDPFDFSKPTLRTLQSGMIASEKLLKDFESAHKDGESLLKNFFRERMFSNEKAFDARIHRNSRYTFSYQPIEYKETVPKSAAMENRAMAQVISLAQSCKVKIDLSQVMQHRVTEECLSIFNINKTMVKVQKSKLIEMFNFVQIYPGNNYFALIDMGLIWRLASSSSEDREKNGEAHFTWADYAQKTRQRKNFYYSLCK